MKSWRRHWRTITMQKGLEENAVSASWEIGKGWLKLIGENLKYSRPLRKHLIVATLATVSTRWGSSQRQRRCVTSENLLYCYISAKLIPLSLWIGPKPSCNTSYCQQKCHDEVIPGQLILTPSSPRATFVFPLPWWGLYPFPLFD